MHCDFRRRGKEWGRQAVGGVLCSASQPLGSLSLSWTVGGMYSKIKAGVLDTRNARLGM